MKDNEKSYLFYYATLGLIVIQVIRAAVMFNSGVLDSHEISKMGGGTAILILIFYFLFARKESEK